MHIEKAIKEAVEKGGLDLEIQPFLFEEGSLSNVGLARIFIDPLFWQALGKARGWGIGQDFAVDHLTKEYGNWIAGHSWGWYWHSFIDHLAEGKSAEDFFKDL